MPGLLDYCASKSAAFAIDESLRMELHKQKIQGVHTTCVCPFFINTGMFNGASTRWSWLLPILEPDYVVKKIIDAIRTNQVGGGGSRVGRGSEGEALKPSPL